MSGSFCFVQPKTEEFLNLLLWSADKLTRPTFRNLTRSYESWAYRNGFRHQVTVLEEQHLVEGRLKHRADRLYRLTEEGRLHALGGRDPRARWSRLWDGQWRIVLFDVPMRQNSRRARLRRYLRDHGFGCLQGSVWVTPNPLDDERESLAGGHVNVESLLFLEGRPCAGEIDAQIVETAWNFERINRAYASHLKVLDDRPRVQLQSSAAANALRRWAVAERLAWIAAVTSDPLLPERLLPRGYLGRHAWERRRHVLREAGRQLRTFRHDIG